MSYIERDTYGMYRRYAGEGANEGPGPELMGAKTLIGEDVYGNNEEYLGDIKEIMLDMRDGRVAYAVLSFGGFVGIGDKLFAIPWEALTLDAVNKRFLLKADKERLKDAPGFDKDRWPDMADTTWASEITTYYGSVREPIVH